MNFEDLQRQWATLDKKLETSIRLNTELLRQTKLEKSKSALQRLAFFIWVEVLLAIPVILVVGSFLGNHYTQPAFFIPGLTLHISAIGLMGSGIYQLVTLSQMDFSAPVLTIQKKLESLRIYRIRETKWTFLLAPLLWTPLLIVAMKGLLGVNTYATFDLTWMAANFIFGLAIVVSGIWVSKRYGHRMSHIPWIQKLMNDLAGNNLNQALGILANLSEFENEPAGEEPSTSIL